jgi:16S rRNA (cytosine967-C5)-methyltransferase
LSRHHSHISSAIKVIETVTIGEPLVHHLKKFFASNKKFGSKDRKSIAALCYNYYRIGNALKNKTIEEKIIGAYFLCSNDNSSFLEAVAPSLNMLAENTLQQKMEQLKINANDIFEFEKHLSDKINTEKFIVSFLEQPLLYVRIRPSRQEKVLEKLSTTQIVFAKKSNNCIALPQATKIEELFLINADVVVQDYSSQQVFNYLLDNNIDLPKLPVVLDCCAASGGKSILMYDTLKGNVDLHVSDVRANMLNNLRNRFKEAGIKKYTSFVADLMNDKTISTEKKYDIIICDAPCTGSGTWCRTPEQLAFFNENKIEVFADMQKTIASKALKNLQKGGLFFYITCSAFKKENEDVVDYLKEKFHLQVKQMEYYKGYETQADTMFAAVLSFK